MAAAEVLGDPLHQVGSPALAAGLERAPGKAAPARLFGRSGFNLRLIGRQIESLLERYDAAWNDQDLDAIVEMHAPGMVFENHTAGTRAEGDEVRGHIGQIFQNWPDMRFRGRKLQVRDGLAVSEWTASATKPDGEKIEWDGVDIFEFENDLIARKGVYSSSATPRALQG